MTIRDATDALAKPGKKAAIVIVWDTETGAIEAETNGPGPGPEWALFVLATVLADWKRNRKAGPQ